MPLSSKFLPESTGEKIVKIGQDLVKIWKKYHSLLFWPTPYSNQADAKLCLKVIVLKTTQSEVIEYNALRG